MKYRNACERHFQRSLIKIFSLLGSSIHEDLAKVSKFMSELLAGNCENVAATDKAAEHATTVGIVGTDYCCSAQVNFFEVKQLMDYLLQKAMILVTLVKYTMVMGLKKSCLLASQGLFSRLK